MAGDLRRLLNAAGTDIGEARYRLRPSLNWWNWWRTNTINGKQAKDVLEKAYASGETPGGNCRARGHRADRRYGRTGGVVAAAIAENPKAVEDYKSGKTSAVQFLVGQVMKRTKGRAKPDVVSPLLLEKLEQVLNALGQRVRGFIGRRYTEIDW